MKLSLASTKQWGPGRAAKALPNPVKHSITNRFLVKAAAAVAVERLGADLQVFRRIQDKGAVALGQGIFAGNHCREVGVCIAVGPQVDVTDVTVRPGSVTDYAFVFHI